MRVFIERVEVIQSDRAWLDISADGSPPAVYLTLPAGTDPIIIHDAMHGQLAGQRDLAQLRRCRGCAGFDGGPGVVECVVDVGLGALEHCFGSADIELRGCVHAEGEAFSAYARARLET